MFTHEHSDPIIYQVVRSFPPWSPHDLSGLRATPGQLPCSAPMIPWSWIFITATTHVLHAHLAAPTASSCCVSYWSLTCLGQSFFQVLDRAKSNQRLAQVVARYQIHICVQAANVCAAEFTSACRMPMSALLNSATAPILVNLSPWRVLLLGLDIPSSSPCSSTIYAADFPLTNLKLQKVALPIYVPVDMTTSTLDTVLDNLPKCAPRAHLTLLRLAFIIINIF